MTQALPSKRSAGSGIVSPRNLFQKARLKLTLLYILIIAFIVFGFSLFLYQSTLKNFADASIEDFAATSSRQHFVDVASDNLQHTLVLSDVILLFFAAGIGYLLAGRTLKPVEASHEAQRLFAAHASHELRTPLAIMRNDIEVLLRDPKLSREQVRRTLGSSLEEIQKMTTMTEDLLFLARSEQSAHTMADTNLAQLAAGVVQKMQPLAAKDGIEMSLQGVLSRPIRGNEAMLSRVLINILQNSIEHTPAGGVIRIMLTETDKEARMVISDTGSGISADELPHVFTRFYKGSVSSQQGTGLGLTIVKEIVDQHGGTVAIASEVGKGTTLTITLPCANAL